MTLTEVLNKALSLAEATNDFELIRTMQIAMQMAVEMQAEIEEMKEKRAFRQGVIRDLKRTLVTVAGTNKNVVYCSVCWDAGERLVQMKDVSDGVGSRRYRCPECKNTTKA